jgi:phytanoyl-CoA hydroxylase
MGRPNILNLNGTLSSELWIDQRTAPTAIATKLERDEITEEEAERLTKFWQDGYAVFHSGLPDDFFRAAVGECHRLWESRPEDLLGACNELNGGRPMSLALFPPKFKPGPGCRVLDAHSHNDFFRNLMSTPTLHRFIDLLVDEKCVATQSLYFSHGSMQPLHRDPWFVVTNPVSTLFAAWIALEDIVIESGPLSFVPRSHRIPYMPLNTGDIIFHDPQATAEARDAHVKDMFAQMARASLTPKPFLAKRGEIFVWHGSLVHGGGQVQTPIRSRESLVIHFDAARNRKSAAQAVVLNGKHLGVVETAIIHERNGNHYLESAAFGKKLTELFPAAAGDG